jgi:serine protease
VIAGVNWVAANHQKPAVANMSLGGSASSSLDAAANGMINHGVVLIVTAVGGNTNACSLSPARVPNAITVGSSDSIDTRSPSSNWGTCLDIFAPGVNITSAWHTSNTAARTLSGIASPHVAGVAALYLQTDKNASVSQVRNATVDGSTKNKLTDVGTGSPNRLLYSLISASPRPISPSGPITDRTPAYLWSRVINATRYQVEVYRGSTMVFNATYTSSACSGSTCSKTPAQTLAFSAHKWRVRAYVGGVWKAWSAYKNFSVAP